MVYFNKSLRALLAKEGKKDEIIWFHKGNTYMRMDKNEKAIETYDKAIEINPKFIDTINNRAMALYRSGKKENVTSELRKILKIKYDYLAAHHNLIKLSRTELVYNSFWNYWQNSRQKKIFLWLAISIMFSIVVITIIIPAIILIKNSDFTKREMMSGSSTVTNISKISSGVSNVTINNITKEDKPAIINQVNHLDIPIYGVIIIGIIALLLLSPIIRSASIGTTSIEFTLIYLSTDRDVELELIDNI